ncbi:4a-hydroxytetrahydrobiopterin dehydratase [Accumulibacter sp.]|uniref:4a-hydroxytetrahydrobiopterin dehydratase n=1 Tax=Accumulibacter sp. TaxID=2053492 RepID=UPI0025E87F65|nr:4a-hydroxytetrahydrobiopterin dehydratase [Accumulibacter sp.]MCM8594534.1 4a-hydroxytetrahydrobiopterin dehydratase [Accumulibacter sp.]MCM8627382.1 4a-hydroxytetrahydrobiopterin dehydratase [Accumulibacter sp.]MDS4048680.1 4a-hydroxytetrahydrobiopterin dehydratase [Accumulibacter sp.]
MKTAENPLAREHCQPIRGTGHRLDPLEITALLATLPGWQVDGQGRLSKSFSFAGYPATMLFVNMIAALAEREDHHPDLEVGYGKVLVGYSTHDVGGLSRNDFICAARVEALAGF